MMIKHKYGAKRCTYDNKKFPSKLERDCYIRLKKLEESGKILFFLRQVPFELTAGYRHFVDFQVFTPEQVIFLESKGRDLAAGRLKREQAEELYGVKIFIVTIPSQIDSILFP